MLEQKAASDRSFAFALSLVPEPAGALARVSLEAAVPGAVRDFTLPEFFDALCERRAVDLVAAPGLQLKVSWR